MWVTTVFAVLVVFVTYASSEHYPYSHPYSHSDANRNQRIIKVHGPPHPNHHHHGHHGHHKHIRNGPLGPHVHYNDRDHDQHFEYIRPNHPPPIPPFFNGHNNGHNNHVSGHNNHVKHLPRPPPPHALKSPPSTPPHALKSPPTPHHKSPSFGSSFPHKQSSNSFRPPVIKEHFRIPTPPHKPPTPPSHDFFSSPVSHIQSSNDNRGPIHEIPAPNLGPKPVGHSHKTPDFHFGKGSSHETPKPVKESSFSSGHGPSYEVTENNHSSNDHVIESHDGTKLYYAPDPDPSLPVHKVPPTKDPYSIPSHGKKVLEDFSLHGSQDFQVLHGGSISAPVAQLSPQELFDLMNGHGNGALLQQGALGHQQVVTLLGQPHQPSNLILPPESQHGHHYQQQTVNDIERYLHQSPQQHGGGEVNQFLQHPEIHNALHSAQQQQGIVHMAMIDHINAQQSLYPQQESQYQIQVPNFNNPQYQSFNYDEKDPSAGAIPMETHQTPQISNNYHYEPEASETRNSMTVIRQADNSDSIKQLLLNDLANNVAENQIEDSDSRQPQQTQLPIFEHRPEVPFYTTLPSREAAEALATLQAAGSIASNYVDKIKNLRGDQKPEQDNEESEKDEEDKNNRPLGLPEEQLSKPQKINYYQESETETETSETEKPNTEEKNVEVQKSIPIYEASYVSSGIGDPQNEEAGSDAQEEVEERREEELPKPQQLDFRQDDGGQKFGRRIRPK